MEKLNELMEELEIIITESCLFQSDEISVIMEQIQEILLEEYILRLKNQDQLKYSDFVIYEI